MLVTERDPNSRRSFGRPRSSDFEITLVSWLPAGFDGKIKKKQRITILSL